MYLIVGGTGTLGGNLTRRLLAKGERVRVMTRTPEKAGELKRAGAEVVQGDLLDPPSLEWACAGADVVVAAAHSIFGRGKEASRHVDLQGHIDLIDAAKNACVQRFVYTSVYGSDPLAMRVPFNRFKRAVEEYLRGGDLPYTILRATAFMDFHAEEMIGRPILEQGKVTLFGRGENPRNLVAAEDVAQVAVLALEDPEAIGQIIDIGGPENLTPLEVVQLYERLAGREAKVRHVPLSLLKVLYRLLRPFHPGLSQVMQMSIYVDTGDNTFDPELLLTRYPMKLTRLEEWAARRLESGPFATPLAIA